VLILEILVLAALAVLWLITLFLIVADDISGGAKALWLLLTIVLAPFAIPVYLVLRHRRHRQTDGLAAIQARS
jgi:hypothetical protein